MSATLAEGSVFARRYRVVRHLAAGTMGSVYEVVHLETNRRRALKTMHAHLFQSEEMRERFKREARIAADVESEYIVDVFDAGVDEATGMPFLVMELLRGEELGARLQRVGRLPPAEVTTYLYQTALALDRTHAASIVHRDLKPANLFLSQREDGSVRVKILDFGVAKLVSDGSAAAGATRSLGTPLYMAPEQFRAGTKLTGAADIYALGMMAYTLLVGTPYWHEEAMSAGDVIAFAILAIRGPVESAVQRARALGVALPSTFDAWFVKATAVDPAARFRTAMDAVRSLGAALGVPVGANIVAPLPSAPPWPTAMPAMTAPAPAAGPVAARTSQSEGARFAATSTGAAVSPVSPRPRRRPLWAAAVAVGVGMVGAGGWLALRASGGHEARAPVEELATAPAPSAAAPAAADATTPPGAAAIATPPTVVLAPSTEPATPAPSVTAAATAPTPTATARASATSSAPRPAKSKPAHTPKKPPMYGQD